MAKPKFKQHFVFDLDDTLIDGRQFCGETMARAITECESHVNPQLVITLHDTYRGATIVDLYKTAIKELDLKTDLDKLLKLDAEIQNKELHKMNIFDGVVDILEFLKSRGKTLHMCTNRKTDTLTNILKYNNIGKYFDSITSCIDAGYKKPNPECLLELIKKNGNKKKDFIYFGDSEIDSQFAKNSGIDFIIFDQYLNEKNLFKKLINMFLEEKIGMNNEK